MFNPLHRAKDKSDYEIEDKAKEFWYIKEEIDKVDEKEHKKFSEKLEYFIKTLLDILKL